MPIKPIRTSESISRGQSACGLTDATGDLDATHPTSADACATITQYLMKFHTGHDPEFSRKAIESLTKKLKDKRDDLDLLINVVRSRGKLSNKCVTIQRTLDGRLQVAGRKGFPHNVYCRIWRWPDLNKNELKHVPICQHAFEMKGDIVCVNPYHYDRVSSQNINSLDITNLRIDTISVDESPSSSAEPTSNKPHTSDPMTFENVPSSSAQSYLDVRTKQDVGQFIQNNPCLNPDLYVSGNLPVKSEVEQVDDVPCVAQMVPMNAPSAQMHVTSPQASQSCAPLVSPESMPAESLLVSSNPSLCTRSRRIYVLDRIGPTRQNFSFYFNPFLPTEPIRGPFLYAWFVNWCTVTYHEYNTKLGESYQGNDKYILVDNGYDLFCSHRFCLGRISNVRRSDEAEKIRKLIGKGIQLRVNQDGDVWLTCLSDRPVFVYSDFLNWQNDTNDVHKVYSQASIKVFDLNLCFDKLMEARDIIRDSNIAKYHVQEQQGFISPVGARNANMFYLNGIAYEYKAHNIDIEDLRRYCGFAVSFVKGWGPDYDRSTIKKTPCWIEVQIPRALQLLDDLLNFPDCEP